MQKIISTIAATGILFFASVASANDASTTLPVAPGIKARAALEVKAEMKDVHVQKVDIRDQIKNVQETVKGQIKDLRVTTKNDVRMATSSGEKKDILQNALEERKGLMDARKASTTALRADLKTLAREHFGLVGQRFAIALKQFDNLTTRIQSRIDKLKAANVDTSAVETLLATAKTNIAQAISDARAVSDIVNNITDTSDPKTVKAQLEAAVKKTNASMKLAHDSLEATVKALLRLSLPATKVRTTTTVETQN